MILESPEKNQSIYTNNMDEKTTETTMNDEKDEKEGVHHRRRTNIFKKYDRLNCLYIIAGNILLFF